jgi:hypothetical protein
MWLPHLNIDPGQRGGGFHLFPNHAAAAARI